MNKKKKEAYNKPSIEIVPMELEGSLLLMASIGTVSSNSGKSTYGGNTIFSSRQTSRTAGTNSSNAYTSNPVFSNRGK